MFANGNPLMVDARKGFHTLTESADPFDVENYQLNTTGTLVGM